MATTTDKDNGVHDDYRRMHLDDFDSIEDVFMFDSSLEALLFGVPITEQTPIVDVSVPQVTRSYNKV
jgi:hypothetical protein